MRRLFFTVIAVFAVTQASFAQNRVFAKHDKVVNASLGLFNTIHSGSEWKTTFPPISLSGEYGIVDNLINGKASIGAGLYVGYTGMKYDNHTASLSYKSSHFILGARGAFHYQFVDRLDTYAGLILGYDIVGGNRTHDASESVWGLYIGARYYFTDRFAVMAEIGHRVSLLNIGVAFKF
ncbi:MAG: porin family protein [Prevotellaceae bacterium]|jgi:hypothetical protein|nr:porin family protein [Prevotellaceae bacterium]